MVLTHATAIKDDASAYLPSILSANATVMARGAIAVARKELFENFRVIGMPLPRSRKDLQIILTPVLSCSATCRDSHF